MPIHTRGWVLMIRLSVKEFWDIRNHKIQETLRQGRAIKVRRLARKPIQIQAFKQVLLTRLRLSVRLFSYQVLRLHETVVASASRDRGCRHWGFWLTEGTTAYLFRCNRSFNPSPNSLIDGKQTNKKEAACQPKISKPWDTGTHQNVDFVSCSCMKALIQRTVEHM